MNGITRNGIHVVLLAGLSFLAVFQAQAAGLMVTVEVIEFGGDNRGDSSGNISLFLNGSPVSFVDGQSFELMQFDSLRVDLSASATTDGNTRSTGTRRVQFDVALPAPVEAATVSSIISGSAEAGPEVATAGIGSIISCDFFTAESCSAPGLPGSLSFTSGVTSSTLDIVPNEILINNESTETGRVGGVETFDALSTTLVLQRLPGEPSTSVLASAQADTIFNASGSATASLELIVTDLTVVPVPAGIWLFGSALGLLVARRRKPAAR